MRQPFSMPARAALLLLAIAAVAASVPGIDPSKSKIVATFKQEGVPVDAAFKRFNGHIDYDPTRPNASKAALEVTTGSIDLGSEEYSAEVRKKGWFDTANYPTATFISTTIKPGNADHFDASGILTLKGKTQTLVIPVSVGKVGTATSFDGELQISRKTFGIGDPEWNDVVDDQVRVKFHLVQ
jgi:polyisoprenoid-binding protein YceI